MKVAIAGVGNVAKGSYLPALSKRSGIELHYWNRTAEKAKAAAAQFGGTVHASLAELCAVEPDAILVLTSEKCRYEVAKELLALRPRRLFFEKPLVARNGQANVTEEDFALGREILQGAKAIGCETAMVFNYRFFEQSLRAAALHRERNLGPLVQATGLVNYACWSHCIDLLHHFGGEFARISALAGSEVRTGAGNTSPDVAVAFTFRNGGAGTIVGTAGTKTIYPFFELTLSFANGRISFRGLDGDMELLDYAKSVHESFAISRQWSRWDLYNQSFGKSANAYLDAVAAGNPPPVPGLAGLRELQFEAAMRKSVRTGLPVTPDTDFPCDL
ncbi:MAG: Gfo/Idh/MocA family oxidoreductase [Lentisphaeria bacterium]|jgi:predicted dehydrogenase|nr:Gfo/Idh/MocA family oxidoreductase [Lentisphaeria bacterium]